MFGLNKSLKNTVLMTMALVLLVAPFAPVIAHSLSHILETQVTETPIQQGVAHQHEHDEEHPPVSLNDDISAIVIQKNKELIKRDEVRDLANTYTFSIDRKPLSLNQHYSLSFAVPPLLPDSPQLYSHLANAPPA